MWIAAIIGAVVGGVSGVISTKRERGKEEKSIRFEQENAEKQYKYQKELADRQFSIQKGQALWQLGMQDRSLREGLEGFTDRFNAGQLSRSYAEQDARIQTASGAGASLAYEGMSGTRGSETGGMMRDYASRSLDRQVEIQDRQDANALAGTLMEAGAARAAIKHEKAAWEKGGYRSEMKNASDVYNEKMLSLKQSEYEYRMNELQDGAFLDYLTAFLSGGSSGFTAGKNVGETLYNSDWKNMFNKQGG